MPCSYSAQCPVECPKLPLANRISRMRRSIFEFSTKQLAAHDSWADLRRERNLKRKTPPLNTTCTYVDIKANQETRVLELFPSRDHLGPLKGRFKIVDIFSPEPYEALSHCWGLIKASDTIQCGDTSLEITKSVSDALRHLRRTDRVRHLWVDYICINQSDRSEKEAQVKHMRYIYANAEATLIWLGEEESSTPLAFNVLPKVLDMLQAAKCAPGRVLSLNELRDCGLFSLEAREWTALNEAVADRPWFSRSWILQEVGLARKAIIQCGRFSCDFQDLLQVSRVVWEAGATIILGSSGLAKVVIIAYTVFQTSNGDGSLWNLLQTASSQVSSDSRDKVFALLGLARDGDEFTDLVDYSKSAKAVYVEVFRHYLDKGRPGMLQLSGNPYWRTIRDLPSWAPDWSHAHDRTRKIADSCPRSPLHLKACPPSVSPDGRMLCIKGFVLGHILTTRPNINPILPNARRTNLRRWQKRATWKSEYPTGESSIDIFARTLVLDAPIADSSHFASPGKILEAALELQEDSLAYVEDIKARTARFLDISLYTDQMHTVIFRNKFFVTHDGYMGLGCFFLRPGDVLVELQGGLTPYGLRPRRDGTFHFLGEAYVHGRMALPDSPDEQDIKEFKLV